MSFETLTVAKYIFQTLSGDTTLKSLLAGSKAPGFQLGVYGEMAPTIDPVSGKEPVLPYIVFSRAGSWEPLGNALCGGTHVSYPTYRVTVWHEQSGSVSYARVQSIADRITVLLDGQRVSLDGLDFASLRLDTEQPIIVGTDGHIDYGLTVVYGFTVTF
jgi:hypothetical protein